MEGILETIASNDEVAIQSSFQEFNEKNKINFTLGEKEDTRKTFCSTILDHVSDSDPSSKWSCKTVSRALTSLRIFAREREGTDKLTSRGGLAPIIKLADICGDVKESCFVGDGISVERTEVIIEATKCLCNILLNNRYLASCMDDLGILKGLSLRLSLCHTQLLPYDVVYFDLRLLFLMTACGPSERVKFRDEYNGLLILINLIDSTLFGPSADDRHGNSQTINSSAMTSSEKDTPKTEKESNTLANETGLTSSELANSGGDPRKEEDEETADDTLPKAVNGVSTQEDEKPKAKGSKLLQMLAPERDDVYCLSVALDNKKCLLLNEALKIVFNQTLNWGEECEGEEFQLFKHVAFLIRVLLLSLPIHSANLSKPADDTVSHCIEVLVNTPEQCASCLLLPPHIQIMPTIIQLYPSLPTPPSSQAAAVCPESPGDDDSTQYFHDLDQVFDDWNMATVVTLLNFLKLKLLPSKERQNLSPILTSLRTLSKGHRSIRRFLKAKILPPVHEVTMRPDEGTTLKSRVVRLMKAGSSQGAEEVTAEFLFVLCKESVKRLIKHTGYGNAAGLLMAHGLLTGGKSTGEDQYSSDSETSDTEEYIQSLPNVDPVTGGPSKEDECPFDEMTEEQKEEEARKLEDLFQRLEQHGIIKVMPLDKDSKPMR